MNKTLEEVIAGILTHNGALVSRNEGDGSLEVVTAPEVSKVLKIPEYARLRFSCGESGDDAIYASYDSEFFTSVAELFASKGKFSVAGCESHAPNIEKLSRLISEKTAFSNATFRTGKTEVRNISYLLFYFKYVALSDDKREGILPLLVNELNLSAVPFGHSAVELKEIAGEPGDIKRHEIRRVLQSGRLASARLVKEELGDFINSLERRLNRDVKRVYEYYDALKKETKKILKKKALANEMADIDFSQKGDDVDKLYDKLDAIEAEQAWKIQDLVAKYALNVKIEPVSIIRIDTQSVVFWIDIKRRLSSRQFPVTFNPILRQIDALPCESCFNPQKPYYVCDDELHIVCAGCFRTCHDCRRQFCSACHNMCPKCGKRSQDSLPSLMNSRTSSIS